MNKKPAPTLRSEDFCRRLESEMTLHGLTQMAVASRLGISQGAVSGWFNRGFVPQPRILKALAEMLEVTPDWLLRGTEPKLTEAARRRSEQAVSNLNISGASMVLRETSRSSVANSVAEEGPMRMVPVLSWAQAGMATAFEEIPEDWKDEIPVAVNDPKAFAVRLRGDSMEPRYQDGDVATVLPGTPARNGDLVIANIKDEGFAFKVMNLVGGDPEKIRLTSYNTEVYQPMDFPREKFHWIHPVHTVTKIVRK